MRTKILTVTIEASNGFRWLVTETAAGDVYSHEQVFEDRNAAEEFAHKVRRAGSIDRSHWLYEETKIDRSQRLISEVRHNLFHSGMLAAMSGWNAA